MDVRGTSAWKGWTPEFDAIDYMKPNLQSWSPGELGRPEGVPEEAMCWMRHDYNCIVTRTSAERGPSWNSVVWRRTIDADEKKVVRDERIDSTVTQEQLHVNVGFVRCMVTELWYMPEEVEDQEKAVVKVAKVDEPTARQRETHELENHAVYRSWCSVCAAARSTGTKHRSTPKDVREEEGPKIFSDFYYMSTDAESAPFLALKSSKSGRLGATALPSKATEEFAVQFASRFMEESGHKRFLNCSDNEPAMVSLKEAAAQRLKGVEAISRSSPVGDHQSNGSIEVAVRELKRQMRALRYALEARLGKGLRDDDPVLSWAANFAAQSINVYRKDSTGKTAYEKEFGRSWKRPSLEFGERLFIKEAVERSNRPKRDWEFRMIEVRFVGHHARTNAVLGISSEGLKVGIAVKRLSEKERWDSSGWNELCGYPWDVNSKRQQSDREGDEPPPRLPPPIPELPFARAFYVQRKDVNLHGFREGCKGCEAIRMGKRAIAHSTRCRERIVEKLKESEEKVRLEKYEERVTTTQERREEIQREREEKEAKRQKVLAIEDKAVRGGTDEKREASGGAESPSKRLRADKSGQKRAAEVAVGDLDPRTSSTAAAEVVTGVPSAPVNAEQVQVPSSTSSSSPSSTRQEGGDVMSLDMASYEVAMCADKWKRVSSINLLERKLEAKRIELGSVDVVEVFSPPRFVAAASQFGLAPGFSVDLATQKPDGSGEFWDLNRQADVKLLDRLIDEDDPYLLTGSPRCDPFSVLRSLNWRSLGAEQNVLRREEGERHVELAVRYYEKQMDRGRYFLHEHPAGADSWDMDKVKKLQKRDGVFTVSGPMCKWGMQLDTRHKGKGFVYKPTRWITNSRILASLLDQRCTNWTGGPLHRHVSLVGGLAHLCERYPQSLVEAVLKGLKQQMMEDGAISALEMYASGPDPTEATFPKDAEEFALEEAKKFYDDISGEELPPELVREARKEEISWVRSIGLYDKVPREVATSRGFQVLPVRWVDVNKGDRSSYKLRSRLVGKELKVKTKEALLAHELFSATPPWEVVKGLFSLLVTESSEKFNPDKKELVMGVFDISRAHFMPKVEREIYVELADEDKEAGEENYVGKLKRNMYGCRDASHGWMKDWQALLGSDGYVVGEANPALFYNAERESRGAVHGDDFYVLGPVDAIDKMKELLGSKYQMREAHRLGFVQGCERSATVLNRVVELGEDGGRRWVKIEPDRRHVELILQTVGMKLGSANGVTTPSMKPTDAQASLLQTSPELTGAEASAYRSATMRASFLAQERADIAETVKRLAQGMAHPRIAHWEMLKRLARYLAHTPDVSLFYDQQPMPDHIRISVDSDFAGCKVGRKSTTGMVQHLGRHVIKGTSNLQSVLGLNVSESEYYALVHGTSHGLGLQAFLRDLGLELGLIVESDSSSAKAFASRRGLGKQRHVQTRFLWLQQVVGDERVVIKKIGTASNVSDILTKSSSSPVILKHMEQMGLRIHAASKLQKSIYGPGSTTSKS